VYPLLALFLAIATGYALGQLSFAGVSFGAGACYSPASSSAPLRPSRRRTARRTLGLVMFVYGVGIQYGRQFFASLRGPGLKYTALTVVRSSPRSRSRVRSPAPLGVSLATAAGCSPDRAPTRRAAGRARARPATSTHDRLFGRVSLRVAGPIILMTIMAALLKPKFAAVARRAHRRAHRRSAEPRSQRRRVSPALPADVKIVVVRHERMNVPPLRPHALPEGDGMLLVGSPPSLENARRSSDERSRAPQPRSRALRRGRALRVAAVFVGKALGRSRCPTFPS
jgi:putative transport protein